MTRQGNIDLTGLNLYNENGGVVQGQICGQGLMTKLLRNKQSYHKKGGGGGGGGGRDSVGLVDNPLLYSTKDPGLCMSPLMIAGGGRNKKYRAHVYENMNVFSHDTESCSSSDGLFSETSSSNAALHQTIEEIQQPTFVAQFDPQALSPPPTNGGRSATQQQQHLPIINHGTPNRKGFAWSSSLPAVVEEQDSQSAQEGSEQGSGIWRTSNSPGRNNAGETTTTTTTTAFQSLADSSSNSSNTHQFPAFQEPITTDLDISNDVSQMMSLNDSDRILPPPSPSSTATPQQQQRQQQQQDQSTVSSSSSPTKYFQKRAQKKLSKQQQIREAMERRIQKAMDAHMRNAEQQQETHTRNQQQIGMFQNATTGFSFDESTASSSIMSNNQNNGSIPIKLDLFAEAQATSNSASNNNEVPKSDVSFLSGTGNSVSSLQSPITSPRASPTHNSKAREDVTRTMHNLLLQQQMSLKDMSLQNYHYRKELAECRGTFSKWKQEKEEQQTTINNLVQEKETYAKEASFLRSEMAAIREELEALRKETQLHAEYKEFHEKQKNVQEKKKDEPQPSGEPKNDDREEEKDNKDEEEIENQEPQQPKKQQAHQSFSTKPNSHPMTTTAATTTTTTVPSKVVKKVTIVEAPAPPTPIKKKNVTIAVPEKEEDRDENENTVSNRQGKPLVSGFKSPSACSSEEKKTRRTVKFHDPPLDKEWALFPSNLIREDGGRVGIFAGRDSENTISRLSNNMSGGSIIRRGDTYGSSIKRAAAEARQQERSEGQEEDKDARDPSRESQSPVQEESSSASSSSSDQHDQDVSPQKNTEVAAIYKYRLEAIQKNRQQRAGRRSMSGLGNHRTMEQISRKASF